MRYTLKEVRAQVRQELVKEFRKTYESRIENLTEHVKKLSEENKSLKSKCLELSEYNDQLEQKNQRCEDWIQRLQEFVNMSDTEREQAIKNFQNEQKISKQLNDVFSVLTPYINMINF